MAGDLEISNLSLILSTLLLVVAVLIDSKEKLGMGNEIIIAGVRAVIQLFIIGYVLGFVFQINNTILTLVMVLFMIFNASYNAHKRSEGIAKSFKISFIAIGSGTALALIILVLSGAIDWIPSQIIPIVGMLASNSMVAIGVVYRSLQTQFKDRRQQVQEKIALGADKKQASMSIVRDSIKTGMAPSIDSTKTVGLVSIPGMMSGLMFAGIDPLAAIRYQIVVMFMIVSATAISSFIATYMAYRSFYNDAVQLII